MVGPASVIVCFVFLPSCDQVTPLVFNPAYLPIPQSQSQQTSGTATIARSLSENYNRSEKEGKREQIFEDLRRIAPLFNANLRKYGPFLPAFAVGSEFSDRLLGSSNGDASGYAVIKDRKELHGK